MLNDFANERGLDPEFLGKYVRTAGEGEPYPGWLAFDYPHLTGKWLTRYRNPVPDAGQRWLVEKGSGTHLYNPTLAGPDCTEVWFAEGEMDTLTLVALGLRAVGIPGASLAKSFKKAWKLLFEDAFVVVAFDNDTAGQGAAVRMEAAFAPRSASLKPPLEGQDINDYWRQDPKGLQAAIDSLRKEHGLV